MTPEEFKQRMLDLAEILNAANRAWTGGAFEEDLPDLAVEGDAAGAYGLTGRYAMDQYGKQTGTKITVGPRVFTGEQGGTIEKLIDQTVNSIIKEYERDKGAIFNADQRYAVTDTVIKNLYSGTEYNANTDTLVVGSPLDTQTPNPLVNYTHRWLNMKTSELQWDPTVPLKEHKMESALISGARDGTFDYATVGLILGQQKMIEEGLYSTMADVDATEIDEQGAWEEAAGLYLMERGDGFLRKFNRLSDAIDDTSADFYSNRRTKGNFKAHLESQVEQNAFQYFGPMETTLDTPKGDIQQFLIDEDERNGIFKEWFGGFGGAEKPSSDIKPGTDEEYSDYEKKGYRVANDKLVAELNTAFAQYMDTEGNPTSLANSQAAISGMRVENWIWDQMYSETNSLFTVDPDTGMHAYGTIAADQTEAARRKKYQTNPAQINTDLKNVLHNNPEFWIKGLPVDKTRVADEVWAQWELIYANNAPEAALAIITGELEPGVVSGFDRTEAEKQAKDLLTYGPNPVEWKEIPFEQQQAIISNVWQQGGVDVNTAFNEGSPDFGFASNIMNFARTGIITKVEAKEFRDTFSNESRRENAVRQAAINQGLLSGSTSPAFMRHFTENIIPNLASKAEFSGATSMDELNEVIGGYFDELEPYEKFESDFRRQMGYDQFGKIDIDTPPPIPGLSLSRYERKEAPPFSLQAIAGQLQNFQVDDPQFAEFIQQEMTLPGFEKDWESKGAEQFDQAAFKSSVFGDVGEEAFEQQKRRLSELESSYEATLARNQELLDDTGEGLSQSELDAAEARVATARQRYADEIGSGSGQDPLERKRLEEKGVKFTPSLFEQYAPMKEAKAKQAQIKAQIAALQGKEIEEEIEGLTGLIPTVDTSPQAQKAREEREAELATIEAEIKRLKGPAPITTGKYGKETFESPGMQLDLGGLTTIEFRDAERRRQTTPGMTGAEFFKSRLPGFEARYKESPFFKLEQDRKQRLAEQETEQKQKDYETQRRRRLRTGGGRGRTIVTRGRA